MIDIARSSVATATMGVDYNLLATTARIGRGQTQAEVVLELLDDDIYETTENLGLYPANIAINGRNYPAPATAANTSVITIEDNDVLIAFLEAIDTSFAESSTATVRIGLEDQPFPAGTPVVFRFASTEARPDLLVTQNGYVSSLTDTLTIVFAEGQTEAVLLIEVAELEKDNLLEPDETIRFVLTAENDPRAIVNSARAEIDIELLDDDDLVLGLVSLSDNERDVAEGQSITLELRTLNGIISDEAISVDYQVVFPKIDGVVNDQLANKDDVTTQTGTVVLPAGQVTIAFPPSHAIMIVDDDLAELYETFRVELLNIQPAAQYASRALRVVKSGESPDTLPSEQIWIRDNNEPNEFSVRITDIDGNPAMEVSDDMGGTRPGVSESEPFRVEALFKGVPRSAVRFTFVVRAAGSSPNRVTYLDFEDSQDEDRLLVVGDTIGGRFDSIASVTITPQNDDASEETERFSVGVQIPTSPDYTLVSQPPIQAVLLDDDIQLTAEFDDDDSTYQENDGRRTETITLIDDEVAFEELTVTVSFVAIYGTAEEADFAISSTVVIPPGTGDRKTVLNLEIFEDLEIEGTENALIAITRLDLSNGRQRVYSPANRPTLIIMINDNDDEMGTEFEINGVPRTVEEGRQYTFTISHTRMDTDEVITFSERVGVALFFERNGRVLDASEAQRFVIRDSSGVPVSDLPDQIGSAANPLTFTLSIPDNDRIEGDQEGYSLAFEVVSPGGTPEKESTRFNVNDNDTVKVIFGQPEYTVTERETVTLELYLDNSDRTTDVTVTLIYEAADNSAIDSAENRPDDLKEGETDPNDFRLENSGVVKFEPGDTVKTIILTARSDEFFEFTENAGSQSCGGR